MPNIPQYNSPVETFQPTDAGAAAISQASRRVQVDYDEAGNAIARGGAAIAQGVKNLGDTAVSFADHEQIHKGALVTSAYLAQKTDEWNKTISGYTDENGVQHPKADPNDPTIAARFMDGVNHDLENLRDTMLTEKSQQWMEAHTEAIRNHFQTQTISDMSSMAGAAARNNSIETINNYANAASKDPSGIDTYIKLANDGIDAIFSTSPNLKGAAGFKERENFAFDATKKIVEGGIIGAIAKSSNPEATADELSQKYSKYISPAESKMLAANARQQIRADRIDKAYADRVSKDYDQNLSDEKVTNTYLPKIYSDNPQERASVSSKSIINDPTLTRRDKEHLVGIVERETKPETAARVSAATSAELFRQMRDPNADPEKVRTAIFDARAKDPGQPGSINKADFKDLQQNLIDMKTPDGMARAHERDEFMKKYGPTIDGAVGESGVHSALGLQKMYEAEKVLQSEERRLGPDWRKLYDPGSSEFFGRSQNIMKYHISMQDADKFQQGLSGKNLTSGGGKVTGVDVVNIPQGMDPASAMKWLKDKGIASGTPIRLPDGRTGKAP